MRCLMLCLLLAATQPLLAQSVTLPTPEPVRRDLDPFDTMKASPGTEQDERLEKIRLQKAEEERRKRLTKDTDRMAQLVAELKDLLSKNDSSKVLSLDSVKKAEEIEKLAKRVKNDLRTPVQ